MLQEVKRTPAFWVVKRGPDSYWDGNYDKRTPGGTWNNVGWVPRLAAYRDDMQACRDAAVAINWSYKLTPRARAVPVYITTRTAKRGHSVTGRLAEIERRLSALEAK